MLRTAGLQSLAQVRAFVVGNAPVSFTFADRTAASVWMTQTLKRFCQPHCSRLQSVGMATRPPQLVLKAVGLKNACVASAVVCRATIQPRHSPAPREAHRLASFANCRWYSAICRLSLAASSKSRIIASARAFKSNIRLPYLCGCA